MVQLIYGAKGSGKTKRLLDMVNKELQETKGDVVFIDDDKRYMYDVKHEVRFVDVTEYGIDSADKLYGFISGMLAQNFDIAAIYLDAFLHIIKKKPEEIECIIKDLEKIAKMNDCKLVLNISGNPDEVPEFLKGYII